MIFKNQYDLKGFYRLVNNERLQSKMVIKSYQKGLVEWSNESINPKSGFLYLFQDSTYGKYHGRALDLGYIQNKDDNGVLIHNGILTDSEFVPLGLPIQEFIQRDRANYGKRHERHEREFSDKESSKWIDGIDFARKFERKTTQKIIQVADKEADVAEVLNYALKHQQLFIINKRHDRAIEGSSQTMKTYFQTQENKLIIKRNILDNKGKWHECDCKMSFAQLNLTGIDKPIYVVYLKQVSSIKGQEIAEWFILTNRKVLDQTIAIEVLDAYCKRWTTCEDFHKCLKTGCSIEKRQIQSPQALFNTIALLSLVAIALLRLRYLAINEVNHKKDNLITQTLSEDECSVAQMLADKYLMPIDKTICKENTNLWFILLIARMGGHQGYKQAGMPGWQTIWKGWLYFQSLVDGFCMSKNFFKQNIPTYG